MTEVNGLGETSEATRETLKEVLGEEQFNNLTTKGETEPTVEPVKEIVKEEVKPEPVSPQETKVEEQPVEKSEPRKSNYVPVSKYNELRHELQDLKKQIEAKAVTPATETKVAGELKDIAEKYNLDETFINEFSEKIIEKATSKAPKLPENLEAVITSFQEREKAMKEETEFEKNFGELSKELPELVASKDDFKRLAFTEGYENTPLDVLAHYYINKFKPVRTAEAPKQGQGKTDVIDFANISEEELKGFNDEQLEAYMEYNRKQSGHYNG